MSNNDDKIFQQMADAYVQEYGKTLLQEQQELQQRGLNYATPRADQLANNLIQRRKKRNKAPLIVFAAAAAILVVFIGALTVYPNIIKIVLPGQEAGQQATPGAPVPADSMPNSQAQPEAQPLNFKLPVQFSVAQTDYDNGESIYKLDNINHDDVVLTIKESNGQEASPAKMDSVIIDGKQVLAVITSDYKLLQFQDQGQLYTLSCQDDLATLASLYRSIVDPENKLV